MEKQKHMSNKKTIKESETRIGNRMKREAETEEERNKDKKGRKRKQKKKGGKSIVLFCQSCGFGRQYFFTKFIANPTNSSL